MRAAPLLVALLAAVPYLPSLDGGFLAYDDPYLVVHSEPIHRADLNTIFDPSADRSRLGGEYLPIRDLTYVLDVRLNPRTSAGGPATEAARGFRIQNLLWYLLACALAAQLLCELMGERRRRAALLAGLLFALHPAHAESVAWVAGRKDVVSGALVFAALLLHLRARREDAPVLHAAVAGVALLACLAKSTATCLPLLVACVELLDPGGRRASVRRRLARVAPTLLACGAVAGVAVAVGRSTGVGRPLDPWGLPARLLLWDPPILRRYVVTAAVPLRLRVHHHGLTGMVLDPSGPRLLHAALSLAVLLPLGFLVARAGPTARFAGLWFVAALVPVANVIPFSQLVADRFLFLPLLGACALLSLALTRVDGREPRLAAGLVGLIVVVWGGMTAARAVQFGGDERLWSANLRWEPDDPTSLRYRGDARRRTGNLEGARADLTRAIERFTQAPVTNPTHVLEARLVLADVHLRRAQPEAALAEALALTPEDAPPAERERWRRRTRQALMVTAARVVTQPDVTVDGLAAAVTAFRRAERPQLAAQALSRLRVRDPLKASRLGR